MNNLKKFLCSAMLAITATAVQAADTFTNPVIQRSAPDPTIIRADNGDFYLYTTEDTRNLPIYHSKDLVNWDFVGTAFTEETRPKWNPKGGIWAPDINKIGDKYVLYYSKSVWGGEWTCGIGVATADRPEGPFTDHGNMFISKNIGVQNSIDQFYIEDNGHKYLFWGSFHGIWGVELSDDGLSVKPGAQKFRIASNFMEGTYIHKRGRYYYLFGSAGACCEGAKSTYTVVYGRSESLFGPYYTKSGDRLLDGDYETMVHGDALVAGPGHNAEIVTDDEGTDWMPMHGYDRSNPEKGRQVWLVRINWKDGWPYVENGVVAKADRKPVFGTVNLADPTVFADNGKYYLYGTTPTPDAGFWAFESDDLKSWRGPLGKHEGFALYNDGLTYGSKWFWAPQVFKRNGKYYMAYTANEHIALATADNPLGPFTQRRDTTYCYHAPVRAIDPFVFFDTDGKAYLYHVRLDHGNRIFVAELTDDLLGMKEETARECLHAEDGWENTEKAEWPVSEGPTVVKQGKTYYLFYSCNDYRSKDYAVGVATASSPLGPWEKQGPVITKENIGQPGTGHGDLFKDSKGNWQYVFHTHYSDTQVSPRRTAVVQLKIKGKKVTVVPGTFHFVER